MALGTYEALSGLLQGLRVPEYLGTRSLLGLVGQACARPFWEQPCAPLTSVKPFTPGCWDQDPKPDSP